MGRVRVGLLPKRVLKNKTWRLVKTNRHVPPLKGSTKEIIRETAQDKADPAYLGTALPQATSGL